MSSYPMPEGELIQSGWSARRAAALALRAGVKDAYTKQAARGAHIRLMRIRAEMHNATGEALAALQEQEVEAELALEAANAAHEAFEAGEAESDEAEVEPDEGDGSKAAPTNRGGRRGGRR